MDLARLLRLHGEGTDVHAEVTELMKNMTDDDFEKIGPGLAFTLCLVFRVPDFGGMRVVYLPSSQVENPAITGEHSRSIIVAYDEEAMANGLATVTNLFFPDELFREEAIEDLLT